LKSELKKFENLKDKSIQISTEKREQIIPPNPPFDLTTLQTESYNLHGITPSRTLQIAQSLYLSGMISYPRTSSQKLPDSIAYKDILEKIAEEYNVKKLIVRKKPIEGKKSDPAHPSIYPTGQNEIILSGEEKKIYDLIAKRFLAVFCDDAIVDNKKVEGKIQDLKFSVRGSQIKKKAWTEIYPIKLKEKEIPDLNGEFKIINVKTEEKQTQPPKRYSPASIISELEKRNLGTKATRSSILETLYDRKYIKEKSIEATSLGMSLIKTLEKYSPIIIDEKLTRDYEKEMNLIQESEKGFENTENSRKKEFSSPKNLEKWRKDSLNKEKKVLEKVKNSIKKISIQFNKHEKEIGKELLEANINLTEQMRKENELTPCRVCKKGKLAITYSKKTKRFFVACNAYPDCKTTYSLPPNGLIKKTEKNCESCDFPMLMRLSKGKRPWTFCFNTECEINKKRIEEYQKRKKIS
jgi:DNA topoisomerase-1